MNNKLIGVFLLLLISCNTPRVSKTGSSQEADRVQAKWQKWIRRNAIQIRPDSKTGEDFHFLKDLLSEIRLVQLGESSHGVREFNQVKVEMIKFLHKELGFNVIAFESGLFECFHANNTGQDAENMMGAIFRVWRTEELLELFDYVEKTRETDKPLIFAGFDFQLSSDWNARARMLKDLVSGLDREFAEEVYRSDSLFADFKKKSSIDEMRQYVRENQVQLRNTYTRLYELLDLHFPGLLEDYSADSSVPLFGRQIMWNS